MRTSSQNLSDGKRSIFWHGRAWFRKDSSYDEYFHVEWLFGKFARDWALTARFGAGDSDAGLVLHACIPFVFSLYLCFPHVYHCEECQLGISAQHGGIWLYTFNSRNSSSSDDPWYKRSHVLYYPWELRHHLTEILEHKPHIPGLALPIWNDSGKRGRFIESYSEREAAQKSVSETYDYTYIRKNGEIQKRKATVFVERMTWRARWWPFIPIQKVRTFIDVRFNEEVGEGTGSWKGGVVGCSHDMKFAETPMECLRRMESEVRFNR